MKKLCTLLVAVVFVASAPSSSDAKSPKGCKRTNVRPANPRGSVLVQPATRAATATAVPLVTGQSTVPVVVFGGPQAATGEVSSISGTVVPSITSEAAPPATSSRSRKKRARRGTSAVIDLPSLPDAGALADVSSC